MRRPLFALAALLTPSQVFADLLGIPSVPFKNQDEKCELYPLSSVTQIDVDANYANAKDERGSTLIPPTLLAFANTFSKDLQDKFGIPLNVKETSEAPSKGTIFLTINENEKFVDAAGRPSSEGYLLTTNSSGIFIEGASPLGVWWGTRTVLQQAILHKQNESPAVPYGHGKDTPGWGTRGMMLDAGRHFYPKELLVEICSYMSYFKQNTFHLHVSDNVNSKPENSLERTFEIGAWFRLWSESKELEGLAVLRNESYTRDDFEFIQRSCVARGVTILPEIEAPGHALRIVQWRPQIGFKNDLTLLNISHPETIPTMKLIWKEFLPWFHSKVVSIGADEYHGPVPDYNRFVNEMNDYIYAESGKSMRIWGTFPPKYNDPSYINISQNVSVQHWAYYYDHAVKDYMNNNYSVVNSDRMYYVVNKWGYTYPPKVPISRTFTGDPSVPGGGLWYPNIFDVKNVSENAQKDNKYLLGGVTPLWNDYGPNATSYLEAYYAWRDGIPALADKQWGGKLNATAFQRGFAKLQPHAPAQNLDRAIPSKGETILDYSLTDQKAKQQQQQQQRNVVSDQSGNDHDAKTDCEANEDGLYITPDCSLETPFSSKGRNYTLELSMTLEEQPKNPTNTTLISGADSVLMLTPNVTLFTSGHYYRLNITVPLNELIKLQVRGRGDRTYASVTREDGSVREEEFKTVLGISERFYRWEKMGIEAPIRQVTGWTGQLRRLRLLGTA